jgi:colanic acid/amylovoran biosynthesis protein
MHITTIGTYSSLNLGNQAMQLGFYKLVRDRLGEQHQFSICTPNYQIDVSRYPSSIRVVPSFRKKPLRGTLSVFWAFMHFLAPSWLGALLRPYGPEASAIFSSDLVVDLSGDMPTDDYGFAVAITHYLPILTSIFYRKPTYLLGQSLGPFPKTGPLARWILQRVKLITTREEISFQYLTSKFPEANVKQASDFAFYLHGKLEKTQNLSLISRGQKSSTLGISLSWLIADKFKVGRSDFLASFAELCRRLCEEFGFRILLVPHVLGPGEFKDDQPILKALGTKLVALGVEVEMVSPANPHAAKIAINQCDMFIGSRMHANIAALSSGVPLIAISYSHKSEGIMGQFGLEKWVVRAGVDPLEELATKANLMASNLESVKTIISNNHKSAFVGAQNNLNYMLDDFKMCERK